ncbi:fibrinogen-like protein A [Clytia hemisphaerica]|uniref:fibrinogen-like protein A n=1 Tax=Clytia hemisphaerica TaxID=252671 RepID=UPI0034D6C07B
METSKMLAIICIQLFVCIFQASSTSTNQTAGRLLDKTITNLRQNVHVLKQSTQHLQKEVQLLNSEVGYLRKLHGHCAPCKPIKDSSNCDCTDVEPMQDCLEFLQAGFRKNGLYKIHGPRFSEINVFCDQTSQGGGFTTILRRQDGSVNFQRPWKDYKFGFGKLLTGFWFGNENMHDLTKPTFAPKSSTLLINMRMKGQTKPVYAKYDTFEIGDEASKYTLKISGASGNASYLTNFPSYHNNMNFSTYDQDNDNYSPRHCSSAYGRVGWWFNDCYTTLLTGNYKFTKGTDNGEISWYNGKEVEPEFVQMMMRRKL